MWIFSPGEMTQAGNEQVARVSAGNNEIIIELRK
jgi:hypothetical protein